MLSCVFCFFFFKQKTAYELRISDWSSDVCSSDLGRLRVDTQRMTVDLNGVPVRLSPLEFRLLDYLVHQGDRAVPAHELADHLYGAADNSESHATEALVARPRRKVGADVIVTRRGFGHCSDGAARLRTHSVFACFPGGRRRGRWARFGRWP